MEGKQRLRSTIPPHSNMIQEKVNGSRDIGGESMGKEDLQCVEIDMGVMTPEYEWVQNRHSKEKYES